MYTVNQQKAALRADLRARRAALPLDIHRGNDQMIWGRIFKELPEFRTAKTLLLYFPLANEINLIPVFNHARQMGVACAFPRCLAQKGEMDFYYVEDLDEMAAGKYGIREPAENARKVTDFSETLAFVPALAMDREGYRIGYGGGYYDRFLAAHKVLAVGVTYEQFLTPTLPRDPYDLAVDVIVTEKGVYRI